MPLDLAWRIARLMRLNRSCPELDAQLMFEPDEWKAAYILNKQKLPNKPPALNEVVRLVARLGGFLALSGDGEPGLKTLWLGMQRIFDSAAGIRFSRELLAQGTCVSRNGLEPPVNGRCPGSQCCNWDAKKVPINGTR